MRTGCHTLLAAVALIATLLAPAPTALAQDKVFVMKLGVATINDTQHEWLKRFVAAVEKEFGRPHQGRKFIRRASSARSRA